MDLELKNKWTTALRSGEYEQGKSYFEKNGKFCCLGVLCVVAGQPTIVSGDSWQQSEYVGNWSYVKAVIGNEEAIPMKLAGMNDGEMNFSEIADWIDANL